jgi:arsenate reductase (thioredoxin)
MSDSVLFLSVSNSCRGQMAEALLRRHAPGRFESQSAGLHPAEIHRLTYLVMNELGMDLSGHRPKSVREFFRLGLSPRFAIILCETTEPDCPKLYPGALQVLRWPFEDPARAAGGEKVQLDTFRKVRDRIDRRIRLWLEEV